MKKHIIFPLWKVEKVEKELSELEQNGWRLDRISGFYCFHFKKATPMMSSYFFTYGPDKDTGMAYIEHMLTSRYGANPVGGSPLAALLHLTSVYRIVSGENLGKVRFCRNTHLQHMTYQRILLGMSLPVLSSLLLLFQLFTHGLSSADISKWIILGFINLIPLAYSWYQMYGLYRLKRQYRQML